ncbi:MAG: energy-coupling factor ABC transporter ATP-binding protein, partial [Bacilli bacterium]
EAILLRDGRVVMHQSAREVLCNVQELHASDIFPPQVTQISEGIGASCHAISIEESVKQLQSEGYTVADVPNYYEENEEKECTFTTNHLTVSYRDVLKQKKVILNEMSVSLYKGERVAIVGNNGAGKSTFLKCMAGLRKPDGGTMSIGQTNIVKTSSEQLANEISYIYQQPSEMFITESVQSDVSYFLRARNVPNYEQTVTEIIHNLGLDALKERDGRLLSGGQQRRASLAIGLAMGPKLMLLDEPTASLDVRSRKELLNTLNYLDGKIETTVIATHDMQLVAEWASRVLVFNEGKIIFDGTPDALFALGYLLDQANLIPPQVIELSHALGLHHVKCSVQQFVESIKHCEVKV